MIIKAERAFSEFTHQGEITMKKNVQKLTVTAAGIALFVVLSLCLQVPVFENYYLCLGYVAMAVYCYSFGAAAGTAVGVMGVMLYCLLINGLRGMPGWALGNAVIGIVLGITFRKTKDMKSRVTANVINVLAVIFSVTVGILLVKSLTECLLYTQPMMLRIGKNIYAWAADLFILAVSLPLCPVMDKSVRRIFPRLMGQEKTNE